MTSKNATHRTPRSPSLSHNDPVAFFLPFSSRTFFSISPLSARKLALLASLTQNANLISKLWTVATPTSFIILYNWLRRKELGFQGAHTLPSLGSYFSKSQNLHMFILFVEGTDASVDPNLLTSDAVVQTVAPQDTKDCSLKYNTTTTYMTLEENVKGLTSIFFFYFVCLFWKID